MTVERWKKNENPGTTIKDSEQYRTCNYFQMVVSGFQGQYLKCTLGLELSASHHPLKWVYLHYRIHRSSLALPYPAQHMFSSDRNHKKVSVFFRLPLVYLIDKTKNAHREQTAKRWHTTAICGLSSEKGPPKSSSSHYRCTSQKNIGNSTKTMYKEQQNLVP